MIVEKKNFLKLEDEVLSKNEVLQSISSVLFPRESKQAYEAFVWREDQGSTGLVDGFAIPHAKLNFIEDSQFYFISLKTKVDWTTLDNSLVDTLVVLLIPSNTSHIGMLSKFSRLMMKKEFKDAIKTEDVDKINSLLGE